MTDRTPQSAPHLQSTDIDSLIDRFLAGEVDQAGIDAMESLLAQDAVARHRFRRVASLDAALRDWAAAAAATAAWGSDPGRVEANERHAPQSRPWIAAVLTLGLVAGVLSSTVVFAASMPWRARAPVITLAGFGWTWGSPPSQNGIPKCFDAWGGDFSRLVNAGQAAAPPGGGAMVRMLRSDNASSPEGRVSNSAELWRFIDLRPLRQRLGSGPLRVTFSAAFNAAAIDDAGRYQFTVGLHAFPSGTPAEFSNLWQQYKADDAAIASALGRQLADRNPGTWQAVDVQLVVPAHATVLLAHTAIGSMPVPVGSAQPVEFPGHYIANVALQVSPEETADSH